MSARKRLAAAFGAVLAAAVVLTGCGPTMADLPLPGNGVAGDTIEIKIPFDEALNLAQGAAVRINGVDSGKVESVTAQDFHALATAKVRVDARMRSTATARLRYSTPLGELFVDVRNPASGPLLRNGDTLDPRQTDVAPTVEDALSSASLLINGGGLNQLQTVTDELNQAIGGREQTVRQLLGRLDDFVTQANASRSDVDRALRAVASLSRTLDLNRRTIRSALTEIRPAARVLRQNTPGLARLLRALDRFAGTANSVVTGTRAQLLQMVQQVSPVLQEFLNNRELLPKSLDALSGVSKILNNVVPGDYVNLRLEMVLTGFTPPNPLGAGGGGSTGANGDGTGGLLGGLTQFGGLLGGLFGGSSSPTSPTSPAPAPSPLSLGGLLGGGR